MRRFKYRKTFTETQVQQHIQLGNQLQRANALASQQLLTLSRLRPDQKRTERVKIDLANVVGSMNLLMGCCESIANNSVPQQFTRIEVVFGITCKYCEANPPRADREGAQGSRETLAADPAWGVLVDSLLLLTAAVIHRTARGSCSSLSENRGALRVLVDLTKALLRQQRHLAQISITHVPEIVVTYDDSEVCDVCGHRRTEAPLTDDEDASSPGIS